MAKITIKRMRHSADYPVQRYFAFEKGNPNALGIAKSIRGLKSILKKRR